MTRETLEKAKDLQRDIKNMENVLNDSEKHYWLRVISPSTKEDYYSVRFQRELAEWLKTKKEEYEKELESL